MSSRVIEIIVRTNDQTGGGLAAIQSKFLALENAIQRTANRIKSFATAKYSATISLIDRVSEPGSRVNSILKSLAGKAYRIVLSVTDSASSKLQQINALAARLVSRAYTIAVNVKDNASKKLSGLTEGLMQGAGTFMPIAGAAGIGFGAANAVQAYMAFEKQMSQVQAVRQLDKNSSEMQALTQQAKDLGATTAWTREQIGQAQYYQALAGWETPQILQSTPHLVNLASAGNVDIKSASDIVTDSMTGFGIKATDNFVDAQGRTVNAVQQYVDMMAKLQASANTDVLQMGQAFKYMAPTIGTMFANVEGQEGVQMRMEAARQAMIMTGLMANAGIKDTMAGTGINTIFNRLAGENRNTHFAEQLLGLEHAKNGQMLMPLDFIKGFQRKAREGMSVEDFYKVAEELSGEKINADTRRKLDSVIKSGIENGGKLGSADLLKMGSMMAGLENAPKLMAMLFQDIDALEAKMADVHGTAQDMANFQLDNLAGDITILGSAWDAFQQSLVEGQAAEGLRSFVKSLTEMVSNAQKLFSDGIQIGDFGKIIFDAVDRLRSKFMELDGIGSILAGGILMGALVKIGNKIRGLATSFRELRGLELGQRTGTTPPSTRTGTVSAAQNVGTMTVKAGTVNISGKVTCTCTCGGGKGRGKVDLTKGGAPATGSRKVGDQSIIDRYNATKERVRSASSGGGFSNLFSGAKTAAYGGAAIAATFGVMDVMSVRDHGKARLQEANDTVAYHEQQLQNLRESGATQAEIDAQIAEVQAAKDFRQRTVQLNHDEEFRAGAGATGAVVGTALGAALGTALGPVGTMVGGMLGGMIGDAIGQKLAEWKLERDKESGKTPGDEPPKRNYFLDDEPPKSSGDAQPKSASMADLHRQEEAEAPKPKTLAESVAEKQAAHEREKASQEQIEFFNAVDKKLGTASPFQQSKLTNGSVETGYGAAKSVNPNAEAPTDTPIQRFGKLVDSIVKNAKPTSGTSLETPTSGEVLTGYGAGQTASGEVIQPSENVTPTSGTSLETPTSGEVLTGYGEAIGVPEINLSATFDNIVSQVSEFAASLPELFSGAFEGLGEMISSGLESASSAASGVLETISTTFTSTKDAICTAWGEIPTFFSGLFDGLGGVASAAGSAILSGLTSVCGAVVSAWESAAAAVSGIVSRISEMASSIQFPSFSFGGGGTGKADGGFVTAETHFFAGEHGPEVVIPLSTSRRARALDLFEKTAQILGGEPVTFGGDEIPEEIPTLSDNVPFVGGNSDVSQPSPVENLTSSSENSSVVVQLGGVTFNISGENPQDILSTIREHLSEVTDQIAGKLSEQIQTVHANQPLEE